MTHIRCRRSKVKPISVPELAELAFSADASSPLLCEKHNLPLSLYDMKNASLVCEKCIERGNFSSEVVPVAEAVAPARERIVSQVLNIFFLIFFLSLPFLLNFSFYESSSSTLFLCLLMYVLFPKYPCVPFCIVFVLRLLV